MALVDDPKRFTTHLWTAHEYLTSSGASGVSINDDFNTALARNINQCRFWQAISQRNAWDFRPEVLQPGEVRGLWPLPDLAIQSIPGMLEETDSLIATPAVGNDKRLRNLIDELNAAKRQIALWLRSASGRALHHSAVNVSQDEAFDLDIEEHCVFTSSDAFEWLYLFPELRDAYAYVCTNVLSLLIDCTLLRLFHFLPSARLYCPRTPEQTANDAYETAKHLCRCIYTFSRIDSLATIDKSILILKIAQDFFEEQAASKEFGWCQACLVASGLRRRRCVPSPQPVTCSVRNLPGLARIGQYRARNLKPSV